MSLSKSPAVAAIVYVLLCFRVGRGFLSSRYTSPVQVSCQLEDWAEQRKHFSGSGYTDYFIKPGCGAW